MPIVDSDKLINIIPELFEVNMQSDKTGLNIFRKLEKILRFDDAYIYFTNTENIQLKYTYKKHTNYIPDAVFNINNDEKKFIFSPKGKILKADDKLINTVGLSAGRHKSFLVSKISIKSTVFGIILLSKREDDFYTAQDLCALEACSSVLSYVLKDMELSNVFKLQLKALKDSVIEKNEAYKTIKEQNERILEADKVKNEFLANISHELRTPLNSIIGFADILDTQLYGNLNDKQQEYVEDIKVSATHLLGMINEILDMSKLEANAVRIVKNNFPISRAITEVSNILMPLAKKKNIVLNCEFGNDFEVYADYQKIQQILYNLVSNAIKYSPENDVVEIAAMPYSGGFRIAVHDNGIGIDKKYHGKIFAKFVQLDSAYTKKESSTGLGLTITKQLAELHGGKVSLISEINNGSTFIVEIPQ